MATTCKCGAALLYGRAHLNCPLKADATLYAREYEQRPVAMAKPRVRLMGGLCWPPGVRSGAEPVMGFRVLVIRPAVPGDRTAFPMVPLAWTDWHDSARQAWAEACRTGGIVNQRTGNSTWNGW